MGSFGAQIFSPSANLPKTNNSSGGRRVNLYPVLKRVGRMKEAVDEAGAGITSIDCGDADGDRATNVFEDLSDE